MEKETLKEVGKGFINIGNLIGGLSVVNSLFGMTHNLPMGVSVFLVGYTVIGFYVSGALLINRGAQ